MSLLGAPGKGKKGIHDNGYRGPAIIFVFGRSSADWASFHDARRQPYDEVEWETRTASIAAEDGKNVFEQPDVEVPKEWSQRATNVVASKYFRGPLVAGTVVHHERGEIKRERSVRELIDRVVGTITAWGRKDGYFADEDEAEAFEAELTHIILHQMATFNSPVWFNVGVEEKPQCSACFILSVEDTMDSILDWCRTEGMIFKGGSGSGVNLSRLRSSREPLSTGGLASGPVSFMRGADAIAGSIKSGGKTRRAAKMVILNVDHPDIVEFIECKSKEERKAYTLGEAGYDLSLDGEAWTSIQFQNANNSVRVTDDFMQRGPQRRGVVAEGRDDRADRSRRCRRASSCARSPRRRGNAAIPACSSTRSSTTGTPARRAAASTPRTRAPNTCTSTTPPATWRR